MAVLNRIAEDVAALKLEHAGPSGDHVTYSVFYKQLLNFGVHELNADVVPNRDAVFAAETYSAHTVESKLVAAMTPLLQQVLCAGTRNIILSNTEEIKWIEAGGDATNFQKPDLVMMLDGLQVPHDPTGNADVKSYRSELPQSQFDYKFGAPPYEARAFISGIIEYKVKGLDSTAKGELAAYLKHLSSKNDPNTYVGLLCDRDSYALTSCLRGRLADFQLGSWSDHGSASVLQRHFDRKNLWLELLLGVCEKMRVRLCPEDNRSAFLGRGGYGTVFRVKSLDSEEVFALKIVLYRQSDTKCSVIKVMLSHEHAQLRTLGGTCTCCVSVVHAEPTAVLDEYGDELGAGYLMSEVGQQIVGADCFYGHALSALGSSVFTALQRLHACGHAHGDARIANIVRVGESVKWIDMMVSVSGSAAAKRVHDIKTLLTSLFPTNALAVTGLMKSNVVSTYSDDCSELNMTSICTAVAAVVW